MASPPGQTKMVVAAQLDGDPGQLGPMEEGGSGGVNEQQRGERTSAWLPAGSRKTGEASFGGQRGDVGGQAATWFLCARREKR
jgi:hypothetical protein